MALTLASAASFTTTNSFGDGGGQYDDADDDDDDDKAVVSATTTFHPTAAPLVVVGNEEAQQQPQPTINSHNNKNKRSTNSENSILHNNLTTTTTTKKEESVLLRNDINNNYNDDDYGNDDDDDWYNDEDDVPITCGTGKKAMHNNNKSAMISGLDTTTRVSHSVQNSVSALHDMEISKRTMYIDRKDRATSEQVLDPRTRMILFKLLSSGYITKLDGCLSTGKEANVYYAIAGSKQQQPQLQVSRNGPPSQQPPVHQPAESPPQSPVDDDASVAVVTEYAIKVYKTSILVFKDRDKYVTGEYRWRKGYCKSNPRKMVTVWAEKEMRNYKRIYSAGILCPQPILLKQHVLIMEFLGTNGWPSPRLKDAILTEKRYREAYIQCIVLIRHLYHKCKLVHGDLSEYNLLWHHQRVYVIDVSQSVETDHPCALEFLRKDIANINDYFRKAGHLTVMTTRQLFEYTTATLSDTTLETELAAIDTIMEQIDTAAAAAGEVQNLQQQRIDDQQEAIEEAVFMSSFLPRSLNQVSEYEFQKLEQGSMEDTIYANAVASMTTKTSRQDSGADLVVTNGAQHPPQEEEAIQQKKEETVVLSSPALSSTTTMTPQRQILPVEGDIESTAAVALRQVDSQDATALSNAVAMDSTEKCGLLTTTTQTQQEPQQQQQRQVHFEEEEDDDDDKRGVSHVESVDDKDHDIASIHSSDDDSDRDDGSDDEGDDNNDAYRSRPRTPEELEAEREARRLERRTNKRLVKSAQSDKRKEKVKKKDKKRAIKKSKAGNKK